MKQYVTIWNNNDNTVEQNEKQEEISSSSEICFEERVEDKNESVKQYVTVSNNNFSAQVRFDVAGRVEDKDERQEKQDLSSTSSENILRREVKTRMKLSNYIIQYIKNNKKTVEQLREMKARCVLRRE